MSILDRKQELLFEWLKKITLNKFLYKYSPKKKNKYII